MNVFRFIANFFGKLFGSKAAVAQTVVAEVAPLANLALPIVRAIETDLKPSALAAAGLKQLVPTITAFLSRYEPDLVKVNQVVLTMTGMPVADILRRVATFALSTLVPNTTETRLLNLAIELAYSILVKAVTAGSSTPSAQ